MVAHELNEAQKALRVAKSQELLDALRQSRLAYILTSDESWFLHYNPHPAKWARTAAAAGERAVPVMTKNKTMVVVCLSFAGFLFCHSCSTKGNLQRRVRCGKSHPST